MDVTLYPILVPMIAGAIVLLIPTAVRGIKEAITLAVAAVTLYFTIVLYRMGWVETNVFGMSMLRLDTLSAFVLLWVGIFGLVMMVYSVWFMKGRSHLREYYGYSLLALGAASGIVLANDMILLVAMWTFLGLLLHLLIDVAGPAASGAVKKTATIVGASDGLLALGVAILWLMTDSTSLSQDPIPTVTGLSCLTFILFASAAFAKAGAMPFHGWIPDAAAAGPTSAIAFLPASLDKLLGIYLLARVSLYVFNLTPAMTLLLMIVGAVTLIGGVLMALVQHDMKKLLGYHAVSQVGYMVLGIGTMSPIGIAGGLFHMLNNAVYKGCLFLTGGSVELREGTTDLDRLGGLARYMPFTFASGLLAALAISGVPPFNGFVSKWMVYQGIIESGKHGGHLWVVWLLAAMFGSALTLASFVKLLHSVFLGAREKRGEGPKEVSIGMWLPTLGLGILCLVFGIFAFVLPLKYFVIPVLTGLPAFRMPAQATWLGWWSPGLATILIVIGIIMGLVIYLAGRARGVRVDSSYVGGEILPADARVTGTGFYNTVTEMGFFRGFYAWGERRNLDVYEYGKDLVGYLGRALKVIHMSVFSGYLTWGLAGLVVVLGILLRFRG
ncbi:MAG TPA: proton-conducting transporter membrane subunit [bacterium]|nr:proton-conducting transporter membrane subunit [bacterium]